ncbi:uncharacterized protein vap [Gasterosteus aculeatus]
MQLHACLLLFIITTDKTLALPDHRCGGHVALDKQPAGLIHLSSPGPSAAVHHTHQPAHHQSAAVPACSWTLGLPPGRRVLLKLVWLDRGSGTVSCAGGEGNRVLESGGAVLLSGCDGHRAAFTWTGSVRPSSGVQLSYNVQEDERNSSEDHAGPRSDRDLHRWSPTGTSFTSASPVAQHVARGTDGRTGRLFEGPQGSPVPRPASSPSSRDQGPLHPTSPPQGPTMAGRADRETLPLPEEAPNNGADTSGAARHADGKMPAADRARPSFQPTDSPFDTTHTSNTGRESSDQPVTSEALPGVYVHKYTATRARSSPSVHLLSSASPSGATWEGGASGEEQPHSWRSHRSTDGLNSDLTSAFTSDPVKPPTEPRQGDSQADAAPPSPRALVAELETEAASFHPNTGGTDSSVPAASEVTNHTVAFEPYELVTLHTFTSSTGSRANPPQSTRGLVADAAAQTSAPSGTTTDAGTSTLPPTYTPSRDRWPASSQTPDALFSPGASTRSSTASRTLQTPTALPGRSRLTHAPFAPPSSTAEPLIGHDNEPGPSQTIESESSRTPHTQNRVPWTFSPVTLKQPRNRITTAPTSLLSPATAKTHSGLGSEEVEEAEKKTTQTPTVGSPLTRPPSTGPPSTGPLSTGPPSTGPPSTGPPSTGPPSTGPLSTGPLSTGPPSTGPPSTGPLSTGPPLWTASHPGQEPRSTLTPPALTFAWSPAATQTPDFYIVPDQPSAIRVESVELLVQIVVEDSGSAFASGLEKDAAAWVEQYLRKAPGFSGMVGVWSSGHAVQSLVGFRTSGALRWLGVTGPASLLERTGLAQAVREGKSFRSSKITNITLGGVQGDVCDWLLQCPEGYECVFNPGTSNYSCSSRCHFDYCHHRGICTHHPGQLPVCRCLVGEDFWFMGRRCDVRMTRARLVGACLAVLLIMVTLIGVLALVAVRRYRAILIQAKVDQTRSSYRRFNHFDELSGRFWLRSWAGSADSLDNPAFTRSDELLHLRALDRPCCYHDDTLSLASTCPSHGARINTIYPHSSQYGWRGSEVSMADGVLDSGKASDLSVCSWPVEPIHWTPFPLLQQLASHRTPAARVSRPRSYCEGMELADLGKSWTA